MAKKIEQEVIPITGGTGTLWRRSPEEPSVGEDCFIYEPTARRVRAARYLGLGNWSLYPTGRVVAGDVYFQRAGSSLLFLERARARLGDNVTGWPIE